MKEKKLSRHKSAVLEKVEKRRWSRVTYFKIIMNGILLVH